MGKKQQSYKLDINIELSGRIVKNAMQATTVGALLLSLWLFVLPKVYILYAIIILFYPPPWSSESSINPKKLGWVDLFQGLFGVQNNTAQYSSIQIKQNKTNIVSESFKPLQGN